MTTLADAMMMIWRCACGKLYTDYTGSMGQCSNCREAIRREMSNQSKDVHSDGK